MMSKWNVCQKRGVICCDDGGRDYDSSSNGYALDSQKRKYFLGHVEAGKVGNFGTESTLPKSYILIITFQDRTSVGQP